MKDTSRDSTAVSHGSGSSKTSKGSKASHEAARNKALHDLGHGSTPAPESERNAEIVKGRVTEDPVAAEQASSSGTNAQNRSRLA